MNEFLNGIYQSPFFGLTITTAAYLFGVFVNKKLKTPLANPVVIASAIVIAIVAILDVPLEYYNKGGDMIAMLLAPATACLAVSIYRQREILGKNLLPVLAGCSAATAASMGSVYLLCKLLKVDERLIVSVMPKSVTTPIAMGISEQHGGIVPVTVAAVMISGITGAIAAPYLIKLFRIKNPVAAGIGIGSCSHALGTSKAIEIGETEGAMSSIAIGISGIMTTLFALIIS